MSDDFEKAEAADESSERALWLKIMLSVLGLMKPIPGSWRIFRRIHLWSAWKMQRAVGADALANVRKPNDKEDVLPAKYAEADEDGRERSGWKVIGLGDKRYDPGVRGGASSRLGKADLIHINEDDLEQGTWTEALMDQALKLNREQYLFRDATVHTDFDLVGVDPSVEDGAAVADGGEPQVEWLPKQMEISVEKPGIHEDTLIPITSRAGYDGQVVSWNQYSNLKNEKSDQQAVQQAKNAGWMAAKLDDVSKTDLMKWVLILGGIGAVLLFHQDIGAFISGLGGGGGGSAVGDAAGGVTGALGMLPLFGRGE